MSPKELFDVAVRVVGVFALLWGLWDLVNSALFYTGYWTHPDMTFRYYLIYGWASIFIGLVLIRAGGILVKFAFPEQLGDDLETEADAESDTNQKL